eukprot:CAMPEP_0177745506 /NCGR_PEP_ID=MMETSP0484_2-20121128/30347_1 /TAXON_ID=354590 /ORGANISM="Rhodomonas lens, Strain RHODO" /LENGTH=73 /DNA_ID=CAMNT_0019260143 /DNA_START=298 /DNA_END=522 /DNA_ORIENTATION=+
MDQNKAADGKDKKANCAELKKKYEACFREWYADQFLRGNRAPACLNEWEDYKDCMTESLKAKQLGHLLDEDRK